MTTRTASNVLGPGLLLGIGLGGFVDGIVLHQILQWHHLLTERGYSMTVQMLADGLFHAASWLAVLIGLLSLWRHHVRSGDHQEVWDLAFLGLGALLMIAGWLVYRSGTRPDHRVTDEVPGPVGHGQ